MIPFPKMHIADSVINRILNTLEDKTTSALEIAPVEMPTVPNAEMLGAQIDSKVATPAPVTESMDPESADAGMVEASALGGSPFNGALLG
jgi:hypothetical protein